MIGDVDVGDLDKGDETFPMFFHFALVYTEVYYCDDMMMIERYC